MKSIYLLGISVVVCLSILYLTWQQKKKLEQLVAITNSIQPIPLTNVLDKDSFYYETQQLHRKIETSYERVHQQYLEVLNAVDNIPVIGSFDYSGEEQSENIRSYHGEDLIDIENNGNDRSLEISLNEPIPTSLLGMGENTNKKSDSVEQTSDKNIENLISNIENSIGSHKSSKKKSNSEPAIVEVSKSSADKNAVSLSVSSQVPKLPELKSLCKKYGVSAYGNKKELVERLSKVGITF